MGHYTERSETAVFQQKGLKLSKPERRMANVRFSSLGVKLKNKIPDPREYRVSQ
jgi:hypothetical protein